jgi:sulfur-oxidizing protein SoxY
MLTRRQILGSGAGLAGLALCGAAKASPAADAAIETITKGAQVLRGRVKLDIPPIAENGFSIFTTVTAESPMTDADYVKAIHLISEKNPIARVASFYFTPAMGEARVSTNIRLSASQNVTAIAVMSDGSLWSDEKSVVVTIAACIDGG